MIEIEKIYHTDIRVNKPDVDSEIYNYDLPQHEQKWVKQELPFYFEKVEYNKIGDLILTPLQQSFAAAEVKKCKEGIWIYINDIARFLPPKYYFYLQYYILEDGIPPEFREADRKWFVFLWHWQKIEWALGSCRTKKRRAGASSQACSNLIYEAIFYKNSNCGLISKTLQDSKDTFTEMVTASYRQLPVFLKPKQVNREDSVSELVFAYKSETIKEGTHSAIKTDEGHRSKINYRSPVLNAYDRSRQNLILIDEGAKFPKETPTSQLLSIISKTLVKGVKRVGWVELCSTVNEMTKGGGAEYKVIWDAANQFKRKPTTNRLVRFFQPAFEAYEGFIDAYGDSVINEPTEEQYIFLVNKWVKKDEDGETTSELTEEDIRLGSKHYVKVKRRIGLEGVALEEEIRQNPCDEDEAFMSAVSDCAFNSVNIKKRLKQLEENPVYKRRLKFFRDEITLKVNFKDVDEKDLFHWKLSQLPPIGEENKTKRVNHFLNPARTNDGAITVDSYTNTQGGKYGSKASAWIGRKYDILNPDETGKPIGLLYGRPKEKSELHDQVMLAAEYFGYKAWYERIADDYYPYFKERGKLAFLGRYPTRLIAPDKKEKQRDFGTPLDEFSLTKQLDDGVHYFEYHCDKIDFEELLEEALIFEPHNRTDYDKTVSFLMLVSCLMNTEPIAEKPKAPLIKAYTNNKVGDLEIA